MRAGKAEMKRRAYRDSACAEKEFHRTQWTLSCRPRAGTKHSSLIYLDAAAAAARPGDSTRIVPTPGDTSLVLILQARLASSGV